MLVWPVYTNEQKRELHDIFHSITKHRLRLNTQFEILATRQIPINLGTLFYNIARLYDTEANRNIINEIIGNMDYIFEYDSFKNLRPYFINNIGNLALILGSFARDQGIIKNMSEFVKQCIPNWQPVAAVKRAASVYTNPKFNGNAAPPPPKAAARGYNA
jgi:hypothetical protein